MSSLARASVLAVSALVAGIAFAADVSGTWTASFETQVGTQSYTFELHAQGNALTGKTKGNLTGENAISDGKVDGNKISFVEKATYQGMPLVFNYTGELQGDQIHFKRELMGNPAEEFDAKRAK
jgi:hypothetical protein